ncbi:Exodeoxyribonuclease VII large subunit [hydrothermal vent metagenome]|uniref:Exodeoxyribonuclease VII large subunit n=1 Tax=hydrothermal vent metagenome TaxID=652676 RepID=A0A3B0R302_9ZZZZ
MDNIIAQESPGDNAQPLTVSEISGALKRVIEDRFGYVRIRGEISGYKRAASGHVYLALKDDKSVIDGVMWKGSAGRLAFAPEDGVEVVVSGKLTSYAGRSKYQVVIDKMELAGEGALMQLFEKLKAKLQGEGLFDQDRKRLLPFLPKTIGVITSPTGSVIRDILHRLADRCPSHVVVWPVLVQGEGAAKQIAAAINGFSRIEEGGNVARPDLVILARGGGSIEDLWSFNEEEVVRAVASCSIPIISAVGHETDTTLSDFAADLRAPTPTAAAEMAVPVRAEWLASLSESKARLARSIQRSLLTSQERLESQRRLMPALADLLRPHQQRIDEVADHMKYAMGQNIARARTRFSESAGALRPNIIAVRLERAQEQLKRFDFPPALVRRPINEAQQRLDAIWRLARQVSPDGPLKRGYARISAASGALIGSREAASREQAINIHFQDGDIGAQITGSTDAVSMPKPKIKAKNRPARVKKPVDDRQADLF